MATGSGPGGVGGSGMGGAPLPLESEVDFERAEEEFAATLRELAGKGPVLEKFRAEYQNLLEMLHRFHDNEERLYKRTRNLEAEIASSQEAVARAKKEEEEAAVYKRKMQDEIEKHWASVEALHEREIDKRNKLNELKASKEELAELVAAGPGMTSDQEKMIAELKTSEEDLTRELETKTAKCTSLREEVDLIVERVHGEEAKKIAAETEMSGLESSIGDKRKEADREQRRRDRLNRELKSLQELVDRRQEELASKQAAIREGEKELLEMELALKDGKLQLEKFVREYDSLFQETHRLTEEHDEAVHMNKLLASEITQRESELAAKRKEVQEIRAEAARVAKLREHTQRKMHAISVERASIDARRDELRSKVDSTYAFIEEAKKDGEALRKSIDDMVRQREILNKNLVRADERTKRASDLVKIKLNTKKNLLNEIAGYREHVKRQREMIEQLEVDAERYKTESDDASHKYFTALEEVKIQELQIAELQSKIVDSETKLKQQQNLYEAVRSDRNLYSKNLIEAQEEINEMGRKFTILTHQIEQLKEEITAKDHALVKEHFDHHKVEKEKEDLKAELVKIKKQILSSESIIQNQAAEIQKLSAIIQEAEEERQRQQKEYEAVVNERDILGTQLIRRNEELSMLYEKIKIQKSTLAKGEAQYRQRMTEIGEVGSRIKELQEELTISKQQVSNVDELRNEVFRLERELIQEKTKVRALTEEMERPLKVHRWRKLEGSDPKRFAMIKKIQALQKTLILKTEEVVEKDLLIQEKEKLYVELKNILARQPGPEVAEQLNVYQQNLRDKRKQMRAMKTELEMYKAQVDEYKYELQRLDDMMNGVKKDWFSSMRAARRGAGGTTAAGGRTGAHTTAPSAISRPAGGRELPPMDEDDRYLVHDGERDSLPADADDHGLDEGHAGSVGVVDDDDGVVDVDGDVEDARYPTKKPPADGGDGDGDGKAEEEGEDGKEDV
eukprot:PLAT4437.6.p1 GENE.PLAT4437.6~~PLAT4437.6.p1  ORF type:complete len:966 (-),score=601.38 PLAT4437.6:117-3014(-)